MAIVIPLPGENSIKVEYLALDFTGTVSKDGHLLPGVAERLVALSGLVHITVMTADTRGTAQKELAGLPVEVHTVRTGEGKASLVTELGSTRVVAMGNGRNDAAMLKQAALGIAVLGSEGTAGVLLRVADVVAPDILAALDLLADPLRLVATLRD
jgi:P-type E1-E2 ATPase